MAADEVRIRAVVLAAVPLRIAALLSHNSDHTLDRQRNHSDRQQRIHWDRSGPPMAVPHIAAVALAVAVVHTLAGRLVAVPAVVHTLAEERLAVAGVHTLAEGVPF